MTPCRHPAAARLFLATLIVAIVGCGGETLYQGKTLSQWIRALDTREYREREQVVQVLASIGEEAKPALREALYDHDEEIRAGVITALLTIDPSSKSEIVAVMSSHETEYKVSMAVGLIRANVDLPLAIETLRMTLHDPDPRMQHHSRKAFCELTPSSSEATPALIGMLECDDLLERRTAALALSRVGPNAKGAVRALTAALADGDAQLQEAAAQALGAIGHADEAAIAALETAAKAHDSNVRFRAVQALRVLRL